MPAGQHRRAFQIRECAGDAEETIVAAAGEAEPAHRGRQEPRALGIRLGVDADLGPVEVGVGDDASARRARATRTRAATAADGSPGGPDICS